MPINTLSGVDVFANLVSLKWLSVTNHANLVSISNFNAITTLNGGVVIKGNSALTSITNFGMGSGGSGLTRVGYGQTIFSEIDNNAVLTTLTAFSTVSEWGPLSVQRLPQLTSLSWLAATTIISGDLFVQSNLGNLVSTGTGLTRLTTVGGALVFKVPGISDLTAFCSLTSVGTTWAVGESGTCIAAVKSIFNQTYVPAGLDQSVLVSNAATCNTGVNDRVCDCSTAVNCRNGGVCVAPPNTDTRYSCQCASGYSGPRCDTIIDNCLSFPCQHGATCVNGVGVFSCRCAAGYTGTLCQTNINECSSTPCQHGGTCIDDTNSYRCLCAGGFSGASCETNIDECASSPCQHGGTCSDLDNRFHCDCGASGYSGSRCQTEINECASTPCLNGGTCLDALNGWSCQCAPGFEGNACATDLDECLSNPCVNGGSCQDRSNGFRCQCTVGWGGPACADIDVCLSQPCMNGATCNVLPNSWTCTCPTGYTGLLCQTNINGNACIAAPYCICCFCFSNSCLVPWLFPQYRMRIHTMCQWRNVYRSRRFLHLCMCHRLGCQHRLSWRSVGVCIESVLERRDLY